MTHYQQRNENELHAPHRRLACSFRCALPSRVFLDHDHFCCSAPSLRSLDCCRREFPKTNAMGERTVGCRSDGIRASRQESRDRFLVPTKLYVQPPSFIFHRQHHGQTGHTHACSARPSIPNKRLRHLACSLLPKSDPQLCHGRLHVFESSDRRNESVVDSGECNSLVYTTLVHSRKRNKLVSPWRYPISVRHELY